MAVVVGVATGIVLVVVDLAARRVLDPPVPPIVGPVLVAAATGGVGWLVASARYRGWGFELNDEWISGRWGVIGRHRATIPRNRVQTVTSENGPVDRFLGLTSVTVHTAGAGAPNLSIPHLDDDTVEWLRHELARGRPR